MDERRYNHRQPWEPGMYETGRTRPPKSYGGTMALLLVIIVFLGGLVGILSILNVRLFSQLNNQDPVPEDPISFVSETQEQEPASYLIEATEVSTEPGIIKTEQSYESIELNPCPASVPNVTQDGGMSLQEIYANTIDSVVSISCTLSGGSSSGTGVILSADGYIVTNAHVVENAVGVEVLLTDQRTFQADLVGADAVSDLAVLKIDGSELIPAQFGDSTTVQVGDSVAAIGDPLGIEYRGTMTDGIISAINRDVTVSGRTMTLIQTNAALNSGNSGGPLINCYGQVIGINTMKISTFTNDAGVEGIGFAIPSATVKDIVDQLMEQGYVSGRPTLGISGEEVSSFYQYYYRWPSGLYINEVTADSSAAEAGIEAGDILISIDDTRITGPDDLNTILYSHEVGDTVTVVIYRGGRQYSVSLTLTESKG